MMNLKEQITNARDVEITPLEVPEWGTTVYLKQVNVKERIALVEQINEANMGNGRLSVFTVLFTLCDESGNLVFGPDDYDLVASKNSRVVDRISNKAWDLNSMPVEEAKKN